MDPCGITSLGCHFQLLILPTDDLVILVRTSWFPVSKQCAHPRRHRFLGLYRDVFRPASGSRPPHQPLGMGNVGSVQSRLPLSRDDWGLPVVNLPGRQPPRLGMMLLVVIPGEEYLAVNSCIEHTIEGPGTPDDALARETGSPKKGCQSETPSGDGASAWGRAVSESTLVARLRRVHGFRPPDARGTSLRAATELQPLLEFLSPSPPRRGDESCRGREPAAFRLRQRLGIRLRGRGLRFTAAFATAAALRSAPDSRSRRRLHHAS